MQNIRHSCALATACADVCQDYAPAKSRASFGSQFCQTPAKFGECWPIRPELVEVGWNRSKLDSNIGTKFVFGASDLATHFCASPGGGVRVLQHVLHI